MWSSEVIMYEDICALILAGGENRRMPVTKGFLKVNGKPIVETLRDALQKLFQRVIISTNNPEPYFYMGVQMIGDTVPHQGPMSGILSGLNLPGTKFLFVIACDMPFINAILVQHMKNNFSGEWDAVVPVYGGAPQPLFGIYSSGIAGEMEESITKGRKSMRDFLNAIKVLYIHEEVVREIDPEGRSFVNINTFEDFNKETGGTKCLV
jgi:molybdopterin-guanine dinucleotide biosynthesis protein A